MIIIRVSIIIPAHKCDDYIERCLGSLVNQTCQDIEIIPVLDEGVHDETEAICERLAGQYPIIKLVRQIDEGVSVARNAGIKNARGEFILFVDADDWVEPDMIEKMLECIDKHGADICACAYTEDYADGAVEMRLGGQTGSVYRGDEMLEGFYNNLSPLHNSCANVWGKLFRRELLAANNIEFVPEVRVWEDTLFNMFAFRHSSSIVLLDECLCHYVILSTSTVRSSSTDFETNARLYYQHAADFVNKHCSAEISRKIRHFILYLLVIRLSMRIIELAETQGASFGEAVREIKAKIKSEPYREAIGHLEPKYVTSGGKIVLLLMRLRLRYLLCLCLRHMVRRAKSRAN